jgi:glucosamine--fructose-6-phosphate aminotransferase (isomerizing)
MLEEALQAPAAVARLISADAEMMAGIGRAWRQQPPLSMLTLARGSSDHAAGYLAYLVMARLHRLVTSLPMSVVTLYASPLRCEGLWSLAFSQSGRSPDLIEPTQAFRERGARTIAIVNDADSPLASAAEWVLPLHAGPELSVAATKSFIAQLVVGARLVAEWGHDPVLKHALPGLADVLNHAAQQDWGAALSLLQDASHLFVVGRGLGLAVAMEVALKLKETCGLHAEALSAAELQHGPKALLGSDFAVLVLAPRGPAQHGLLQSALAFRNDGATVLVAAPPDSQVDGLPLLPLVATGHEDLDPISAVQSFYPLADALARARGRDPDRPRHLAKVTLTR